MMHFELYRDADGDWRWRLKAGNGRVVASSGEGYQKKFDALAGIDLVRSVSNAGTPVEVLS